MTQAQANACKAKGLVFYNGGCQRRNNKCCNNRGYLGQVANNIGWGRCIDPKTGKDCVGSAPKQVNNPGPQTALDYVSPFLLFANQQPAPAPLGGTGRGLVGGVPAGTAPPGSKSPAGCGNCNPIDVGCAIGKQFCEFQAWLAKNVGGAALPAVAVTGVIVLLLALKR